MTKEVIVESFELDHTIVKALMFVLFLKNLDPRAIVLQILMFA